MNVEWDGIYASKVTLNLYKQEGSQRTTVHPSLDFHKSGISNGRISK